MADRDVTVIGAGVAGLTTAVALQDRGLGVRIVARERSPRTVSALPGAFWHPFKVEETPRVLGWARRSYARLAGLAAIQDSGVVIRSGRELFRADVPDPWWREAATLGFSRLSRSELPEGRASGWRFVAPIAEAPRYLDWLARRFAAAGGEIEAAALGRPEDAAGSRAVVVCAGLGARELVPDARLRPSRGQLVFLEPVALDGFVLDIADPGAVTYVIPRADAVVCGGTDEEGVERAEPTVAATDAILARARALVPALASARVLRRAAGLRPCRDEVRLEAGVLADGRPVVHNYGHGGAGFTLSWGCAEEAAALIARALGR